MLDDTPAIGAIVVIGQPNNIWMHIGNNLWIRLRPDYSYGYSTERIFKEIDTDINGAIAYSAGMERVEDIKYRYNYNIDNVGYYLDI